MSQIETTFSQMCGENIRVVGIGMTGDTPPVASGPETPRQGTAHTPPPTPHVATDDTPSATPSPQGSIP